MHRELLIELYKVCMLRDRTEEEQELLNRIREYIFKEDHTNDKSPIRNEDEEEAKQ